MWVSTSSETDIPIETSAAEKIARKCQGCQDEEEEKMIDRKPVGFMGPENSDDELCIDITREEGKDKMVFVIRSRKIV